MLLELLSYCYEILGKLVWGVWGVTPWQHRATWRPEPSWRTTSHRPEAGAGCHGGGVKDEGEPVRKAETPIG